MVTGDVVEVLAPVLRERAELPHHFSTFFILRRFLITGKIADINRDIPVKRRRAILSTLLGLPNPIGERLPFAGNVSTHMSIADRPEPELFWLITFGRNRWREWQGTSRGQKTAARGTRSIC